MSVLDHQPVGELRRLRVGTSGEDASATAETVVAALSAGGVGVRSVQVAKASLEQVFAELTQPAAAGDPKGESRA